MLSSFAIHKEAGALGAIVEGLDLRDELDDDVIADLRAALLEHLVICIRGQAAIGPEHQIAFGRRWGVLEPHPYVPPIDGYPEIIRVYDPVKLTETWHADFTYATVPPAISMLLGRIIPPYGGDTMFSNGYLAYDGLSEGSASSTCARITGAPNWRCPPVSPLPTSSACTRSWPGIPRPDDRRCS
jgi:taurine dioxygenase